MTWVEKEVKVWYLDNAMARDLTHEELIAEQLPVLVVRGEVIHETSKQLMVLSQHTEYEGNLAGLDRGIKSVAHGVVKKAIIKIVEMVEKE